MAIVGRAVEIRMFWCVGHDASQWRRFVREQGDSALEPPQFGYDMIGRPITAGRVALGPGHEVMGQILSDEAEYFLAYP